MLSGGVAAKSRLREVFAERTAEAGLKFYDAKPILTTDNAAMIAAAGHRKTPARRNRRVPGRRRKRSEQLRLV
jgi:N6-L-threonylcarbamoyladenine synthase